MAEDFTRRGGPTLGRLLVAVIFLALLGGIVGYGLGVLSKRDRATAASGATEATTSATHCPSHAESLAGVALYRVLYVRTAGSEVWICRDAGGRLYYQGHRGQPNEQLVESQNALFLSAVVSDGDDGYVATNTSSGGRITKYHVTPDQLVTEFINYDPPQAATTQPAVRN